ncbi:mediator of RNA polymerase ii transcription subunit 4 [Anaeramoeba flamelloides]|uniref:Mediator of RNA polymerase II transcription subunit 4 n=1 Tax=Anaeramoeba flamelloides TaxID=1746091 RepID=A0AAV7ZD34_9EUKA|nr:mediator of RNA polymerase ii transcription subunit [Anaeramoeba flamelloides]KAJ6244044.1 mediator of RNA polymerase ii transcription subunit 4 [Anaeramoeba flamelloides]
MSKTKEQKIGEIPIRQKMKQILGEYELLVVELVKSILNSTHQTQNKEIPKPEKVSRKIIQKDFELKRALNELIEHQKIQEELKNIQEQIQEKDQAIINLAIDLRKIENLLQKSIDGAQKQLKMAETSKNNKVTVDEIISYGNNISKNTAPRNYDINPDLGIFRRPYPTKEHIMKSILYKAEEEYQQVEKERIRTQKKEEKERERERKKEEKGEEGENANIENKMEKNEETVNGMEMESDDDSDQIDDSDWD